MAEGTKKELIDRVGKLLALAINEGATEAERDSAAYHAAKLMHKYGIEESQIKTDKGVAADLDRDQVRVTDPGKKRRRWETSLAYCIGQTFDVEVVNDRKWEPTDNGGGMVWYAVFLGFKADVEVSTHFFKYLRRTIGMTSKRAQVRSKRDFAFGMVERIEDRLRDAFKYRFQFAEEAGTTDIIVVKDQLVADFMKDEFPNLKKAAAIKLHDRASYMEGRKAGDRVTLSRPIANSGGSSKRVTS